MNAGNPYAMRVFACGETPNGGLFAVDLGHNRTAPRRCANTVGPRGLADNRSVD